MFKDRTVLDPDTGCRIWQGATAKGRPKVKVYGRMKYVSRIVCEAVHGPPPTPQHQACHKPPCRNGLCVGGNHLYWGTPSENALDIPLSERLAAARKRNDAWHAKVSPERKKQIVSLMNEARRNRG